MPQQKLSIFFSFIFIAANERWCKFKLKLPVIINLDRICDILGKIQDILRKNYFMRKESFIFHFFFLLHNLHNEDYVCEALKRF